MSSRVLPLIFSLASVAIAGASKMWSKRENLCSVPDKKFCIFWVQWNVQERKDIKSNVSILRILLNCASWDLFFLLYQTWADDVYLFEIMHRLCFKLVYFKLFGWTSLKVVLRKMEFSTALECLNMLIFSKEAEKPIALNCYLVQSAVQTFGKEARNSKPESFKEYSIPYIWKQFMKNVVRNLSGTLQFKEIVKWLML